MTQNCEEFSIVIDRKKIVENIENISIVNNRKEMIQNGEDISGEIRSTCFNCGHESEDLST